MTKRFLFVLLAFGACSITVIFAADENVRAAQTRLKESGFYFGELNGVYDGDTSAAVSRYQIRNGLPITGQLNAETSKALGLRVSAAKPAQPDSESWRRLRKTDQQFLEQLDSRTPEKRQPVTAAPKTQPPAPSATEDSRYSSVLVLSRERLRDYVGAFILAGLDPTIGAELEFFADRVTYFNEGIVDREKIRGDLARYNQRWPERRFWLAGEVEVEPQADSRIRVAFPLRYQLRNGRKRSSGRIQKTLLLEVRGEDLQIVAVNERKAG